MHGTFPQLLSSQVIIKRRYNMIYIGALVLRSLAIQPRKIYFLVGYTVYMWCTYSGTTPVQRTSQHHSLYKDNKIMLMDG
jgi:hypothetical protein